MIKYPYHVFFSELSASNLKLSLKIPKPLVFKDSRPVSFKLKLVINCDRKIKFITREKDNYSVKRLLKLFEKCKICAKCKSSAIIRNI